MAKRTSVDWSKHELSITKNEHILIHDLKKPGSVINRVKFINTQEVMCVTGDFGNWIFCREFHPSKGGSVSDSYWVEKLSIASEQIGKEYDQESTEKEICNLLANGLVEYGYEGKKLEEMKEYLETCLFHINDELGYTYYAYREHPIFCDSESVVFCTKTPIWLQIIFDAFEECCRRSGL